MEAPGVPGGGFWRFGGQKTSENHIFLEFFKCLSFFNSKPLDKNQVIGGPDQDDADAIISCAALRYFSSQKHIWDVPNMSKKEGWIFGV